MESNDTPLWALELREFTEFSLGGLEQRLGARLDSVEQRLETTSHGLERITRKIDKMDGRLEDLAADVRQIKMRLIDVERR